VLLCAFELMGGLDFFHQDSLYLFVHMRISWACMRLVLPRTWYKSPVANCFATDRSKAVTPMVNSLFVVSYLKLIFSLTHALFSSLPFGCEERLCFRQFLICRFHFFNVLFDAQSLYSQIRLKFQSV
jgi:hypothetical protein